MAVTAKMVQELRANTGAGMMDCKKALEATGGDVEAALDHLRKQGMKSAAKKAGRETAEGRVFAAIEPGGHRGHLVAVACETDFLSKGEGFRAFVGELCEHVASQDPDGIDDGGRPLVAQRWKGEGAPVADVLQEAVGKLKENIRVSDLVRLESSAGRVGAYIHHDAKQGALAAVRSSADTAQVDEFLKSLCQHVVVFTPPYLRREDVPAQQVERERAVIRESEELKKKPAEYQDKIIEGKLGKFFSAISLYDQPWIHDDKLSVKKALEKQLGKDAELESFKRVRIS